MNQNAYSYLVASGNGVSGGGSSSSIILGAASTMDYFGLEAGANVSFTVSERSAPGTYDNYDKIIINATDTKNLASMTGTLGVGHGGTGVSTLGAGVVYHSASGTGALSIATAANIVSAIGNTAVNRATADASGNNIASTYLTQTDAASTYALKTDISGIYKYKGSVATAANLPASPSTGDVYNIEAESSYGPAGTNVAWTGSAWDSLGGIFSISTATNAQIEALFA